MAKNIQNMPARYRAQFSQWRNTSASNTYGNTGTWINGINSGQTGFVSTGYQQATTLLLPYNQTHLSGMTADELAVSALNMRPWTWRTPRTPPPSPPSA